MDVSRRDDPESPDAAPLDGSFDLTPRTAAAPPRPGGPGRGRALAIGGLVAVVGALAWVLFVGLNDAATFFYNVDEAVERQDQLQGERFRIQGSVVDGTVEDTEDGVGFVLRYGGAQVAVEHTGTPPELFGPKIPVVLEGTFEGDRFASDQILVKHDNTYDEDNPDRILEAERDAGSEATAGDDRGTGG